GLTDRAEPSDFRKRAFRAGHLGLVIGWNRADHSIRLRISRSRSIGCGERGWRWSWICDAGPRLDQPGAASSERPRFEQVGVGGSMEAIERGAPASTTARQAVVGSAWLVVGLGNQGEGYVDTPHNVGFDAVDYLADQQSAEWASDADG